jgi:hypothetical protein
VINPENSRKLPSVVEENLVINPIGLELANILLLFILNIQINEDISVKIYRTDFSR